MWRWAGPSTSPFWPDPEPSPRWDRLLTGPYGRDGGWLLPASLLVVVARVVRAATAAPYGSGAGGDRALGNVADRASGSRSPSAPPSIRTTSPPWRLRWPGCSGSPPRWPGRAAMPRSARAALVGMVLAHGRLCRLAPSWHRHRAPGLAAPDGAGAGHRRRGGARWPPWCERGPRTARACWAVVGVGVTAVLVPVVASASVVSNDSGTV